MELQVFRILSLGLIHACIVLGDYVETTQYIKAFVHERVTLPCKFTATSQDWMFIRWTRTANGTTINIASTQNHVFNAEFTSTAPQNFMDHAHINDRMEDDTFHLDIVIDGFICSDVGVFTCEVFTMSSPTALQSSTTLEIEARPGVPSITANYIEVRENDTFRIECNSDVGVPAHPILWMYTLQEAPHIYQKIVEGIEQEDTPSENCKFNARSTLSLQMTAGLDRATFICATTTDVGEDGAPEKHDKVTIVLYGKTTTTTTKSSTTATTQNPDSTDTDVASSVQSSVSAIFVCCLVTVFNRFRVRT